MKIHESFPCSAEAVASAVAWWATTLINFSDIEIRIAGVAFAHMGRLVCLPMRELTELVQPGRDRYQHRDDVATAKALMRLGEVQALLEADNLSVLRVFDVLGPENPERVTADTTVGIAIRALFGLLLEEGVRQREPNPRRKPLNEPASSSPAAREGDEVEVTLRAEEALE